MIQLIKLSFSDIEIGTKSIDQVEEELEGVHQTDFISSHLGAFHFSTEIIQGLSVI